MKQSSKLFKIVGLLLVVGLLFAALPTGQVKAATITVTPGQSIQTAINGATAGDTITVAAGTYVENVVVNKAITLEGAGSSTTKIVATDGNQTTLSIAASGAIVRGFEITHNYTVEELAAWTFSNSGVTFNQGFTGSILENCIVSKNRNGVYLNTTYSNTVKGNTIQNNRTGINMTGVVDGTKILNNTIANNWTLGIVYYQSGSPTDLSTLTVTDNTFTNNWYTEILIKDVSTGTGTLNVTNNTFSDSPVTYTTSADPSLNEPGFAAQRPVEFGGLAVMPSTPLPTLRIYNSPSVTLQMTTPKTILVGPVGMTIQAAIDAASAGDTINVAAGTYNEDLEIGKSITIVGPNATISPNTVNRVAEAVIAPTDQVGVGDPAVLITAPNITVTLKGLTFDMVNTKDVGGSDRFVELINKTGVTMDVQKNQFLNAPDCINGNWYITGTTNPFMLTLIDNYFYGSKASNGISLWGDAHTVVIQNNVWKDNGGWAVNFNNVSGSFSGNQVLDIAENGANWSDEQAGFLFAFANNLTLTGNTFDGLPNPHIRLYPNFSGTLNATGNTFSNSEDLNMGVVRISDGANLSGVHFKNNQFLNNPLVVQNADGKPFVVAPDFTPNWFGSANQPAAGLFGGTVNFTPWCANAECTEFLPAAVTIAPVVTPAVCGNTTKTTIEINVAGIPASTPLQGYQFRLHFEPTKTSIKNITTDPTTDPIDIVNGGFVANGGMFVVNYIDETTGGIVTGPTGIVDIAYTQFLPSTSTVGGKLALITLTHKGLPGDIALTLSNVLLSSRDGFVIPSEASATATTLTLQPAVLNTTKSLGYCDLASAVAGAVANDVLQLQADITIPATVIVNKSLTLDLNGKVATYLTTANTFALNVDGTATTLTVMDLLTGGKILVVDADADADKDGRGIEVTTGGTLIFNSGTIEAPYAGVYLMDNAKMTLDGGTLLHSTYGVVTRKPGASLIVNSGNIAADGAAISGNGSTGAAPTSITITGGTITSTKTAIYQPQDGTLTITGGTISGNTGIEMKAGNLVVTGGTILGTGAFADPTANDDGSVLTGDAILLNGRNAYTGAITVTISGTPIITSTHAYALRDYNEAGQTLKTSAVLISGGEFRGGPGKQAVTFSAAFVALPRSATAGLMLTGGSYNTDPASPNVYVFVPNGTVFDGSMYKIVGISLNAADFAYVNYNTSLGYMRGVTSGFTTTNFNLNQATAIVVKLYSGNTLFQTNTFNMAKISEMTTVITSPFDIFGTFNYATDGYWTNGRQAEYGQHLATAPTKVVATVTLPGGTLTAENILLAGLRTDILPGVKGLVTLQGILAPRAGVQITLTSGTTVLNTPSTALTDFNYRFTGVETLTYTFTTYQPRYLNVTTASDKTFLVDRDRTMNPLKLYGGDVVSDGEIDINDVSAVGLAWGSPVDSPANINYDGIVNIQDLALVGGNYLLNSATAYNWWSPLP